MTLFPHILSSVEGMTLVQCWSFSMEVAEKSKIQLKCLLKSFVWYYFLNLDDFNCKVVYKESVH